MALSAEIQRRIFLYFGVPQVSAASGGGPSNLLVSPGTDKLVTALTNLTTTGETTAGALVLILDAKWADLIAVSDSLQVRKAGPIELRDDEFNARRGVFNFFLGQLDATLFPDGMGILWMTGSSIQGPYLEP